jgi:hypothetical protein
VTDTFGVDATRLGAFGTAMWFTAARTAGCEGICQGIGAVSKRVSRASNSTKMLPRRRLRTQLANHENHLMSLVGVPATEANPKASDRSKSVEEEDAAAEEAFPSRGHAASLRKARASTETQNGRSANEDVPKGFGDSRPS